MSLGVVSLAVVMMLAMLGVGYTLWAKSLYIQGTVNTGTVNAEFVDAFTDDDNMVNDEEKDSGDIGRCPLPQVDGGPSPTSCDPAASGRDPKPRYEKDVGQCFAMISADDPQLATVTLENAYPSYYCTAWFDIHNTGSIPVRVRAVMIDDMAVEPCQTNAFDLDGDGLPDVEIHVTDIELCQQIDPSQTVQLDLDIHVLQEAPQDESLEFQAAVELGQYNEVCVVD